jgi:SpoVK/Ycf46/Vps4 family AAA+-type ATPase
VEAAVVQLFVEAKRHKPSILYIPSLVAWCAAVSETARTTVRAMLDSLAPTDPILLLAVVDGPLSQIPSDVREWFGHGREHRVAMVAPTESQRTEFFADLIKNIQKPPNQFPDAAHRKKRVLEDLPLAPPSPPRTLTSAEIAVQKEADEKTLATLNFRLAPVMQELKKKFKRFTKPVMVCSPQL